MSDLPLPLVPADCDLRDLPGFMMNTERMLASELWALSDGRSFKAAFALWCRAWKQVPAASLPDTDSVLASFAGLTLAQFTRDRAIIMRGFIKCSDGRWYHRTLSEDAHRAWASKLRRAGERNADAQRLKEWRERRRNGAETGFTMVPETGFTPTMKQRRNALDRTGQDRTGQDSESESETRARTPRYFLGKELRRRGLPASEKQVAEWSDFLQGSCKIKQVEEAPRALHLIMEAAKSAGVMVAYYDHAAPFAEGVARILKTERNVRGRELAEKTEGAAP